MPRNKILITRNATKRPGSASAHPSVKKAAFQKEAIKNVSPTPIKINLQLKRKIAKQNGLKKRLEDRSTFEKLLAKISNRFISISADSIDEEIFSAQKDICEVLGFDISTLWQFSPDDPGNLFATHVHMPVDYPVKIPAVVDGKTFFPWCLKRLKNKEVLMISDIEDVPEEAKRDLETMRYFGDKSLLVFPLYVGNGETFGAISFVNYRQRRKWPEEFVGKMQIVAQIFASALHRKFVERSLRESERHFRMLFEAAPVGIVLIGMDGKVRMVNDNQARMYGYGSSEELEGFDVLLFIAPKDRERVSRDMQDQLQGKALPERTYTAVRRDGSEFLIEVVSAYTFGLEGEPMDYVCITRDITKIREADSERTLLRNELAHLSRVLAMSELSTSFAHEINQPLGAILNNASAAKELLSKGKDALKDIDEILADIIQDSKRAGDVVRKIRGMVKKDEIRHELLNINTLIENAVELFQNSIRIHGILLHLDLKPDLRGIQGERIHLQQVLVNLIMNALEAMEGKPQGIMMIRSTMAGADTVTVSISDSGKGIDAANKDTLFEPFVTTKKEGLGMGLSICKSIIEDHGGRIWAENNPVTGATFSFTLKVWEGTSA